MKIFDGKQSSQDLLNDLQSKIKLEKINAKLVSILVGNDKASEMYSLIKQKAAQLVGFEMEIVRFDESVASSEISEKIKMLNIQKEVNGIMIQLPLPEKIRKDTDKFIEMIDLKKDVDGLNPNSPFISATVKAIYKIIKIANVDEKSTIAIVGSNGEVGKRLSKLLSSKNYNLILVDIADSLDTLKNADVVISATGKANLISPENLRDNSVLIDVGAPKAEFSESCYKKARFYTPVPGGVGPMTIACLMENLYEAAKN